MFKKPLVLSLTAFLILMFFTSVVKNSSRNLEKKIDQLNKDIAILEYEINDAQTDYIYLSSPERIKNNINYFTDQEYLSYDYSRIFFSTDDFLKNSLKETKYLNIKKTNEKEKRQ
tara:strand:- start:337 stop:681 length:345 start_codon:yes stop_codon:yes gene_type:complete